MRFAHYAAGNLSAAKIMMRSHNELKSLLENKSPVIIEVSGNMFQLGHWITAVAYYPELKRFFVVDASAGVLFLWSHDELKYFMDQSKAYDAKILQDLGAIQLSATCLFGIVGGPCWIKDALLGTNDFSKLALAPQEILAVIPQQANFHRYNCITFAD